MKEIHKEIRSGLPAPVYYIYGKDRFFLSEAVKEIKESLPAEERDTNLFMFDFDRVVESPPPINEVFELLNTPGFFGSSRFLILKNLHLARKKEMDDLVKHLDHYLSRTVEYLSNRLLILSAKPPVQSLRKILKDEWIFTTDRKNIQLRRWIKRLAKERKISISEKAVDLLVNLSGGEGGVIHAEIEKLGLMGKKEIEAEDVYSVMYGAIEGNIFSFTEAVIAKDRKRAFTLLSRIDADPHAILGAMNWKLKDVEKKKGGDFSKAFEELLKSDLRIKTSSGSYPLEELVFRLLRI